MKICYDEPDMQLQWKESKCINIFTGKISSKAETWKTKKMGDNIKMNSREICCEDGRWMELAHDRVQWQALVLAVLNLRVLLPES
jgi:hypothetical protein